MANRTIKFRAQKSTDYGSRGEFVYGYYIKSHERPGRTEHWIIEEGGEKHLIYEDSLCQFTGLLDKHGKEIYEGDIVYSPSWQPEKYEVVFDRGGFCLKLGDDSNFYPDIKYSESMEVIGNVFKHKDLLSNTDK